MPIVTMKSLLEAGVHFGHQTRRWNPKMRPYIFTERNGIYILDLQRTMREIVGSYRFVRDLTARGGKVLFVGTKKQAQDSIAAEAQRAGQPYVNQRWLGGMLTNFATIRSRVERMEELERMFEDGTIDAFPKKERLQLRAEYGKLERNLSGIRDMSSLPGAMFVVDTKREAIPVKEAHRLGIPIVGLVDTNADPDEVDYVVPGNDDAIRSVALVCKIIADAAIEGSGAASDGAMGAAAATRDRPTVAAEPVAAEVAAADAGVADTVETGVAESAEPEAAADASEQTAAEATSEPPAEDPVAAEETPSQADSA